MASVRASDRAVKNGKAAGTTCSSATERLSKPLLRTHCTPLRGKGARARAPASNGRTNGSPGSLAGTTNDIATSTTRWLPPREEPKFNSLTQGDDESDGEHSDAGMPPDFVGSKHQRTQAGGPAGFFLGDWVVRVSRTKAELMVLTQLAYWFGESTTGKLRAKRFRDGNFWVYKSHAVLAEEVRLTRDQVRGALRSLQRRGLVVSFGGLEAGELPHYRLDPVAIDQEVEKAQREPGASGRRRSRKSNRKGGRRASSK